VLGALSLLLKPHSAFWLVPAFAVVLLGATRRAGSRAGVAFLGVCLLVGVLAPLPWYLHAAAVHRVHPVPGATTLDGWFDGRLLLDPRLPGIILRQDWEMVFTPLGVVLACLGMLRPDRITKIFLAWGAGVLLQCAIFATRMFDVLARGTEYYQLPMVPVAAVLVARGLVRLASMIAAWRPGMRHAALALGVVALLASAALYARPALAVPAQYESLLDDCAAVQDETSPGDELLVIADRGGTILYYCDRRGTTLAPVTRLHPALVDTRKGARAEGLGAAWANARWVFVPFPELLEDVPHVAAMLERDWQPVATRRPDIRLYERKRVRPSS
jgi:hypothetical protein